MSCGPSETCRDLLTGFAMWSAQCRGPPAPSGTSGVLLLLHSCAGYSKHPVSSCGAASLIMQPQPFNLWGTYLWLDFGDKCPEEHGFCSQGVDSQGGRKVTNELRVSQDSTGCGWGGRVVSKAGSELASVDQGQPGGRWAVGRTTEPSFPEAGGSQGRHPGEVMIKTSLM